MNVSIIRYILGFVLRIEAALLLLPALVGFIYGEATAVIYLEVAALSFVIGFLISVKKPVSNVFYLKEGCVTTALAWIVMSVFGALPFFFSGEIPAYTDALFETISGFTTTGASILSDVESLTHASLFWRSFTHWIGGMGVLVFLLAILPMTGGGGMNLMKAESPGPSVGKLVPKVGQTARILYVIYFGLTVLELVLLCGGGLDLFDSLCTSFGTAGTGGFGIHNDSITSYTIYQQWVITVFMLLFGVNFNFYYLFLFGKIKEAFKMEEVRVYFGVVAVSVAIIFTQILNTAESAFKAFTDSSFQVASIITTTGFSTADFDTWSQTAKLVLVLLMFIGACAGSTGGGIKVSRFVILGRTVKKELNSFIHPKSIRKVQMDGKLIEHEVVRATNVYFITFMLILAGSVFLVSLEGQDLITSFTAVAATFNNIGPGLSLVGPTCNFGFLSGLSKYVCMFDMLAGRLELFPLLILCHPAIWKDTISQEIRRRRAR